MANVRLLYMDPNYGVATEQGNADTAVMGQLSVLGISGLAINVNGNLISGLASPVSANDAVSKSYVDGLASGIDAIPSVSVYASSNVALSGLPSVDGYQLVVGDRILLGGQTNAVQNGVWIVGSGAWTRPTGVEDYISGRDAAGIFTFVEGGNTWANLGFLQLTKKARVDADATSWSQFTGAADIVAGNGLIKSTATGNTVSVLLAPNPGLTFTAGALDALLDPAGGLNKAALGLGLTLNANRTLAVDSNGLRTLGLPSLFTVAGNAVSTNVTAANLSTLSDGNASLADALHSHRSVLESLATVATHTNGSTALSAGDPVQWSSTAGTLQRCDAAALAKSQCIGVAAGAIAASATGKVVKRGVAAGVLSQATPGQPIYLAAGGGLTAALNSDFSGNVVRMGWAVNSTDLDVQPQYIGQRLPKPVTA